jgi:Ni/Co efflux regulator RcnB
MTPMKTLVAASFLAFTSAGAAFADPPGDCPASQATKGSCARWFDDRYWRAYDVSDLAYEEGFRDGQRVVRWEIGRALPLEVRYVVINDYDSYHLSQPPAGHYYAKIGDRVLLVNAATQLVLDALIRNE